MASKKHVVVPTDESASEVEEKKEKVKLPTVSYWALWRFSTAWERVVLSFAVLCAIGAGSTQPLLIVIFGELTDATASISNVQELVNPAAKKLCVVAVVAMMLFGTSFTLIPYVGARQVARVREAFFKAVLRQDMAFFDRAKPGEIEVMITEGAEDFQNGVSQKVSEALMATSQMVVGFFISFYYSWELGLILLACMPFLAGATALMIATGVEDGVFGKEAYASAGAIATEAFGAMRTIASFGGEVVMSKRYDEKLLLSEKSAIRGGIKAGIGSATMFAVMFAMYGVGFWYGGKLINDSRKEAILAHPASNDTISSWNAIVAANQGNPLFYNPCAAYTGGAGLEDCVCDVPFEYFTNLTMAFPNCGCKHGLADGASNPFGASDFNCQSVGTVMTSFFAILVGGFALGMLAPAAQAFTKARIAGYKLFKIIDRVPPIDIQGGGKKMESRPSGQIEFRNVHFSYSGKGADGSPVPVFSGIDLTIKSGETVAFVGESGSGKSTIGKLVQRCYDPNSGSILLDGTELKELDVNDLRSNIGVVSQEPLLFDRSIRDNIAFGRPDEVDVGLDRIQDAARAANAHTFIESDQFPKGYDTIVGAKGGKLSGGQKQRIAIARAVLRNPAILILDEATSALDTESEKIVQQALDELLAGEKKRTTIVIAHRLTTVRKADRIVVLGRGETDDMTRGTRIMEQGTHEELMAMNGMYRALVGSQGSESAEKDAGDAAALDMPLAAVVPNGEAALEAVKVTSEMATKAASEEEDEKDTSKKKKKKKKKKDGEEEEYKVARKRLWAYVGDDMKYILMGTFSAMLSGTVWPGMAFFFAELTAAYSEYEFDEMKKEVMKWSICFWGLALGCFIFNFGQVACFTIVGERITTRIRSAVFRSILRQDISFFDDPKHSIGALSSQLSTEAARIQVTIGQALGSIINTMTSIAMGCAIAFFASWKLSIVVLAAVPLLGGAQAVEMSMIQGGETSVLSKLADAVGVVSETITGMREVQAFQLQRVVDGMFNAELVTPNKEIRKNAITGGVVYGISQFIQFSFYAMAFYYGGKLISEGDINFLEFMKALFALAFAAFGAGQAATFAGDQAKAKAAKSRIFRLMDTVPPIDSMPWDGDGRVRQIDGKIIPADKLKGRIELSGVKFAYPTRSNAPVFNGMSLTIEPGQSVALIGQSGSGKSTVIQLLERFYDPSTAAVNKIFAAEKGGSNSVLLDGVDVRTLDVKFLRSIVGLVGQEPILFYGTIRDNIAWGKLGATDEEIVAAAKAANAHDFIMDIGGYDTNVGIGGGQVSGGQKQRIAIARAIIKNPKILLLDEATSALDNESEKIVQASLDKLIADSGSERTTVMIAHRLSTIRNANCIYVLENDGSGAVVVESGTHDELMSKKGKYALLRQAYDNE